MAFLGAVIPAFVAWYVSPLEGMNRVVAEKNWNFTRILLSGGTLLTIGSLSLIYGAISGNLSHQWRHTYCGVTLLIGLVMLDTVILGPQASLVSQPLKLLGRVESRMASLQVLRNYIVLAPTVAVLFIAGSAGVGMAGSSSTASTTFMTGSIRPSPATISSGR